MRSTTGRARCRSPSTRRPGRHQARGAGSSVGRHGGRRRSDPHRPRPGPRRRASPLDPEEQRGDLPDWSTTDGREEAVRSVDTSDVTTSAVSRRSLLRSGLITAGGLAAAGAVAAGGSPGSSQAGAPTTTTLPVTNGDQALRRLLAGNQRFVSGVPVNQGRDSVRRAASAEHQSPFAVILGCSDSRVPPEVLFDTKGSEISFWSELQAMRRPIRRSSAASNTRPVTWGQCS